MTRPKEFDEPRDSEVVEVSERPVLADDSWAIAAADLRREPRFGDLDDGTSPEAAEIDADQRRRSASPEAVLASVPTFSEYDDGGSSAALEAQLGQIRRAEAAIGEVTGEPVTGLLDDAEFRVGDDFVGRLPAGEQEGAGDVLGFVWPGDGRLVVRDSVMAEQSATLVHEGLHRWNLENAGEPLGPAALNEAITEHLARSVEPVPDVVYDELPDGRSHVYVNADLPVEADEQLVLEPLPETYPEASAFASELESVVGRLALLDLLRTNDHHAFSAEVDSALGRGAWKEVLDEMTDDAYGTDWTAISEIMRRRR